MPQVEPSLRAHVQARWGRWLHLALGEAGVSKSALAKRLEIRRLCLVGGYENLTGAEIRDRSPRSMVAAWLKGGYATADRVFSGGQILGEESEAFDGLRALYASGHYAWFINVAFSLIAQGLELRRTARTLVEDQDAMSGLEYPLRSLAATPLAFAHFDSLLYVDIKDSQKADSSIVAAARFRSNRAEHLEALDLAWASRAIGARRWELLFDWARLQQDDYRNSALLAWDACIASISLEARDNESLHSHWVEKAKWFDDFRRQLYKPSRSR